MMGGAFQLRRFERRLGGEHEGFHAGECGGHDERRRGDWVRTGGRVVGGNRHWSTVVVTDTTTEGGCVNVQVLRVLSLLVFSVVKRARAPLIVRQQHPAL